MLPDGSGYDVCRELRRDSEVPIIMLTARGEETDRVVGLELGADDYVVKPFSAREVVARIRAVLRRSARAPGDRPRRAARGRRAAARPRPPQRGRWPAAELDLTRREFELLELLMREAGSVVTRERLIDEVWDVNWFGSTKTLDVHVSSLRRKLGEDSGRAALHPHGPRRGLPARGRGRARGGAAVSLRARLLAAFAYVLVLVIVALEVPLALNLSRRVDAEIKSEAQGQAAAAGGQRGRPARRPRELRAGAGRAARDLGGRVIVVGPRGRLLADSAGTGLRRRPRTRAAPRSPRALRGAPRPGHAPQRHAGRGRAVHRRAACCAAAGRWARCA